MTIIPDSRSLIFDSEGHVREGVVVVKVVGKCGPYGYRVTYIRGSRDQHTWEYLGLAEPGLAVGTYAPGVPLRFFQGRARHIEDKRLVLVGNWDSLTIRTELDDRLESAGYLEEVIQ